MAKGSRSDVGSKRLMPNGKWEVRVSCGRRADGSRRVVTERVATEAEADARIREIAAELGRRPDMARGITLAQLWAAYQADRTGRLANSTMERYRRIMAGAWLPAMGERDISSIARHDVQQVLSKSCSPNEARQRKATLSSCLSWAVRQGWLMENPIRQGGFEMPGGRLSGFDMDALDADPFAEIEGGRDVWDARTVLEVARRMVGTPLEPAWLCMVGAGLRVEEAFVIRRADIRRIEVGGRQVTQLAVHHARNASDGRHGTKTRQSVRIAAMMEPFGERLWEIAQSVGDREGLLCKVSVGNYRIRWRTLFSDAPKRVGARTDVSKGALRGIRYLPLSRMRATHATLMQEAGVLDSVNAAAHGHSERVSYSNYQRPDVTGAALQAGDYLSLVS